MKANEKVYVKSFSGATIADLKDYARPSQRYNPDLVIAHIDCNELRKSKTPEEISDEIVKLAKDLKTDGNEVIVGGIVARSDALHEKGMHVNELLVTKCSQNSLAFIDHSNILANKHMNGSGIHLNFLGTKLLSDNFLRVINV